MDKKKKLVESLKEIQVDALLCRIPENILFLTGYWPNTGHSAILYPVEGNPLLIVPKPDVPFIPSDWDGEVLEYGVDIGDEAPDQQVTKLLSDAMKKRHLLSSRVGCEHSFEAVAGSHVGGEVVVPGRPFFTLLETRMPGVTFECQSALIKQLRMCKTLREIESLRICHEIVKYAIGQAKAQLREGIRETDVAAIIESNITTYGVGYSGISRARGFAFVVSGPSSGGVYGWGPYNISTDRVLQRGDLVLIELDAYADGYWLDITRTFVVGTPDERQREIMDILIDTVAKVVDAVKPGVRARAVNKLARDLIQNAGYGDFFPHNIGHGVGFAFHEMPYLVPESDIVLEPGMVLAIEPGIYIPDWGGIRIEDNIVVTENGDAIFLSDYERGF